MADEREKLLKKRALLLRIAELTKSQYALIEEEDTDALEESAAERQTLINECVALRAGTDAETDALLAEIAELSAQNEILMRVHMDEIQRKIKKLNAGRKTYRKYEAAGSGQIGGIYLNQVN